MRIKGGRCWWMRSLRKALHRQWLGKPKSSGWMKGVAAALVVALLVLLLARWNSVQVAQAEQGQQADSAAVQAAAAALGQQREVTGDRKRQRKADRACLVVLIKWKGYGCRAGSSGSRHFSRPSTVQSTFSWRGPPPQAPSRCDIGGRSRARCSSTRRPAWLCFRRRSRATTLHSFGSWGTRLW